jgi:hypothetical protein
MIITRILGSRTFQELQPGTVFQADRDVDTICIKLKEIVGLAACNVLILSCDDKSKSGGFACFESDVTIDIVYDAELVLKQR